MNDKRWHALGEWLMELSALVGVFPPLELFAREGRIDAAVILPLLFALFVGGLGLYLLGRY